MRGQRSAEPDGRHRADSVGEKINVCVYNSYFRLMAHGRVYEASLGETVNFSGARLNAAYFMRLGETPRRSL